VASRMIDSACSFSLWLSKTKTCGRLADEGASAAFSEDDGGRFMGPVRAHKRKHGVKGVNIYARRHSDTRWQTTRYW
jgi:hypothetical protein